MNGGMLSAGEPLLAPASHFRGSKPITGCFVTAGINCLNRYVSPHQAGPGDHRYWIVYFCAKSILGAGYPHLVHPQGCRIKCCMERKAVQVHAETEAA